MPHVAVNYSRGFIVYFIVIATKVVSGQRSAIGDQCCVVNAGRAGANCWRLLVVVVVVVVGSHANTLYNSYIYIFRDNFLPGVLSYSSVSYWYYFGLCCVTILTFAIDLFLYSVKSLSTGIE